MELILLDWTRMGKSFCLAGVVVDRNTLYVVRPLPAAQRDWPARKLGWESCAFAGYERWQVFELVGPEGASQQPPHVEDVWVRDLRPLGRTAPPDLRRAILDVTAKNNLPLFGTELLKTTASAFSRPNTGRYSLTTVTAPASAVAFFIVRRDDGEKRVRVTMPVPGLGERTLPVTDHHLQLRAAAVSPSLERQADWLNATVRGMGPTVAVRLGLSRPFAGADGEAEQCWLMADGFFSPTDPQP